MSLDRQQVTDLLTAVAAGRMAIPDALERLAVMPVQQVGDALIDTHRALRTGYPEVVYGAGKTPAQIEAIVARRLEDALPLLVTRIDASTARDLAGRYPGLVHRPEAGILHGPFPDAPRSGPVAVVSAGTSDLPVAEEAALTLELHGVRVDRVADVGVTGLHRVLAALPVLRGAVALVVVAGMEAALASVVAGLVSRPVFAVPTSVGYGAHFGGLASLLGMLNSCAPGVGVVNIDNGFGAGMLAAMVADGRSS
ncbi:MAG: nickel pincer cofactor biosynthesis protein LarB [Candidatus Sericytochromatia bacterium]|nr:nickel pincer cofactor biosynthesis protein LarB [Candidatus Sericytochromatia bacterium]